MEKDKQIENENENKFLSKYFLPIFAFGFFIGVVFESIVWYFHK